LYIHTKENYRAIKKNYSCKEHMDTFYKLNKRNQAQMKIPFMIPFLQISKICKNKSMVLEVKSGYLWGRRRLVMAKVHDEKASGAGHVLFLDPAW